MTYALTTGMDYASLMNSAGNFVEPTLASTQAAVQNAIVINGASTDDIPLQVLTPPLVLTTPLFRCQVAINPGLV